MLGVERTSGFNDRWRWMIRRSRPFVVIDCGANDRSQCVVHRGAQTINAHGNRPIHFVVIGAEALRDYGRRLGSDEDWDNRSRMTRFVEILQVQRVVPHLIQRGAIERRLANFELHNEDHGADEDDGVDAASHSRDVELQEQAAG